MVRACMKWALCRSNLHPSMSQNLDGAMNAARHVMHEFALKALGFMHVMHAIFVGHVYACHGCLRYVCTLPRVPCVQHTHACLSCMPCVLSIMHVFHKTAWCQHTVLMSCMLVFSYAGPWQLGDKTNSALVACMQTEAAPMRVEHVRQRFMISCCMCSLGHGVKATTSFLCSKRQELQSLPQTCIFSNKRDSSNAL